MDDTPMADSGTSARLDVPPLAPGARERRCPLPAPDCRKGERRLSDGSAVGRAMQLAAAAFATLDKLSHGVLLVDRSGRVHFANRSARTLAATTACGLQVSGGRLRFDAADANAAFEAYLAHGAASGSEGLVLRVDGVRARTPCGVLVSPLATGSGRSDVEFCVFILAPAGKRRALPMPLLTGLYGLTAAEARLTSAMFDGRSLADSAVACGITLNTARSVLKRIFSKCAVHSQAELLLLLSLASRTL